MQLCNDVCNLVNYDARTTLMNQIVTLSSNNTLKWVGPDEVQEDAQLADWSQIRRVVISRSYLRQDKVQNVSEGVFAETKSCPKIRNWKKIITHVITKGQFNFDLTKTFIELLH
jgi:hypothetical protein